MYRMEVYGGGHENLVRAWKASAAAGGAIAPSLFCAESCGSVEASIAQCERANALARKQCAGDQGPGPLEVMFDEDEEFYFSSCKGTEIFTWCGDLVVRGDDLGSVIYRFMEGYKLLYENDVTAMIVVRWYDDKEAEIRDEGIREEVLHKDFDYKWESDRRRKLLWAIHALEKASRLYAFEEIGWSIQGLINQLLLKEFGWRYDD